MRHLSEIMDHITDEPSWFVGDSQDMRWWKKKSQRVHLFALGDVGAMVLVGLRLMAGDTIQEIGIYDVRENVPSRWEFEANQIISPNAPQGGPRVRAIMKEELFDCDVFLFCASLRVPPVDQISGDVRMAQFEVNAGLMKEIAGDAVKHGFRGMFCVISDPVDPLCKVAVNNGLPCHRVKGFGLGVMNARACYYAQKDPRFASYLTDGRAYGPHGEDLVIANSLVAYDDELSLELTDLAAHANLVMREMGFKPYVAPALSSAALSIAAMLRGEWHYSSTCMGEVFFGARNRLTERGIEIENPSLPDDLYQRCLTAYENLKVIV